MSFILESIKQAERERKLGQQQSPSISIEYTGAHVDDIENKSLKWLLPSFGVIVVVIMVWGMTNYFANKDRQYIQELSANDKDSPVKIVKDSNRNIAMVPVKNLHASKLKSVKLITAENEFPVSQAANEYINEDQQLIEAKTATSAEKIKHVKENLAQPKIIPTELNVVTGKVNDAPGKQQLAEIYSDLAKLAKQKPVSKETNVFTDESDEGAEELVQIKTASYVSPEANSVVEIIDRPESKVYEKQYEKAVSSGVPSFGELPYDIQEKIPDFNVSVHMFHADPMQRRIRINGSMYTEGKSLLQDLALVEITRYGAVFDYQGHLFRLNVR